MSLQPDPALAAREARLRHWTYGLFAFAGLFLVLASAAVVVVVKYMAQVSEAALSQPAVVKTIEQEKKALSVKEGPPSQEGDVSSAPKEVNPKPQPAPAPATPHETKAQRDLFLQSTALLTVSHLCQAYLNIGLLADAWETDVYTDAEAAAMLDEVIANLGLVDAQLAKVQGTKLEVDDQNDVARVRLVSATLKALAQELKAYWEDPSKDRAVKYKTSRAAAWERIKPLMRK
jgi:hypothetical protein